MTDQDIDSFYEKHDRADDRYRRVCEIHKGERRIARPSNKEKHSVRG